MNNLGIDPLPRAARPVDAVVTRLRRDILSSTFGAGAHLPPERALAAALGVSRLTLRAGLARLEAEGLVRARQGDGVRVLDVGEHASLGVLAHMDLAQRPDVVRSFLELRRAVAAEAVALACARASDETIDALEALALAQAAETDDAAYARRDVAFARALLRAAESFATLLLFNALEPVYAAHPELARALTGDRERSLAGYGLTVALLRARDADRARTTMREALEQVDAEVLEALGGARSAPRKRPAPRAARRAR
jgi:GntR family transcriptional repressor for pyruvate dehydrogenase complex